MSMNSKQSSGVQRLTFLPSLEATQRTQLLPNSCITDCILIAQTGNFKLSHCNIQIQALKNAWDFSTLKPNELGNPADFKREVSKLINISFLKHPIIISKLKKKKLLV
jgi:hypothetical protein